MSFCEPALSPPPVPPVPVEADGVVEGAVEGAGEGVVDGVAEGAVEAALDWTSKPWDLAPLILIVTEAGGKSTSLEGNPTIYEKSLLSTNGKIHEEALALLR